MRGSAATYAEDLPVKVQPPPSRMISPLISLGFAIRALVTAKKRAALRSRVDQNRRFTHFLP